MKLSRLLSPRMLLAGFAWLAFGLTFARAQDDSTVLPRAQVGQAYLYQVTTNPAAGDGASYDQTGLPKGLALNKGTGRISGTPTEAGTFTGTIYVTPMGLSTEALAYTLTVDPALGTPAITSAATATGKVGVGFTYNAAASNSPRSFNIVGDLPAGLTATDSGVISGTPVANGTYALKLSANNASGTGAETALALVVEAVGEVPSITSAATAAGANGAAFTFTLTASNTPLSFSATGLPLGLALDVHTGVISGTPTVDGVYPVQVTATNNNGTGAESILTISIGALSVITPAAQSGSVGTSFTYTPSATNSPTSFTLVSGSIPAGLNFNAANGTISGVPTTAGASTFVLSANNASGAGPNATISITISTAPVTPGGGGGVVVVQPPVIITQPAGRTVDQGASVTFSVVASGPGLTYQWLKGGTAIAGATTSSYTLASVTAADAGAYSVRVTNGSGSISSTAATLVVNVPVVAPTITTQPASQVVRAGTDCTLTVVAAGSDLTYQWRKDGTAVAGATSASLALSGVQASNAGSYTVVVSNSAGSVTSSAATVSVVSRGTGTYFGNLGSANGTFALYVRTDGTGAFLAFAKDSKVGLVSRDIVIDEAGHFRVTVGAANLTTTAAGAAAAEYVIEGTVALDGSLSGTISGMNLAFAAPVSTGASTVGITGFYEAGAAGTSSIAYSILGTGGEAYVLTVTGTSADAGRGTVTAAGAIAATTDRGNVISGSVQAATISVTSTPATGTALTFVGANNESRADIEKLFNISTRSQTGDANVLIAGFNIKGTQPKQILIRAIGPTLKSFNVGNALNAAHIDLYQGSQVVASGNDWGAGPNASQLPTIFTMVGAFPLAANSRDAALLVTLQPGSYTAVVSGQGAEKGVAMVEAYDATPGLIPAAQRIMNISTRATSGLGEDALIAGFVVRGSVPKRVLIRGAGPALTKYNVSGVLAQTTLSVYSGDTVIAQNTGWSTSPDAAALAAAAAQVGGFPFAANSGDSALILNLMPGMYTVKVSGVNGTTGVGLVEVYDLP